MTNGPIEEEEIRVSCTGLRDVNEALAWVVRRLDERFTAAGMVRITINQVYVAGDEPGEDRRRWIANISGMIAEGANVVSGGDVR